MLCQKCCKREAQFHSYRIINNELMSVHLCPLCVVNKSNGEDPNSMDEKMHSILDVLLKKKVQDGKYEEGLRCESCGMTLEEYEKSGLLGCPRCYELFADTIFKQRAVTHETDTAQSGSSIDPDSDTAVDNKSTGGAGNAAGDSKFLKRLETRLKKAVESEDFEEAAHIRDRLKNLEKEGFFGDS